MSNISFPNQNHGSTLPLIAGSLERKSRVALKGYDTGYYVITPSKYLHQFKSDDDFKKDPTPELSLYLPDCTIGAVSGEKFNVKGKDASKGKVGGAMAMSHELQFKAHSAADAEKWYSVIKSAASGTAGGIMTSGLSGSSGSAAASPADSKSSAATSSPTATAARQPAPLQTHQPTGYQASPITPGSGVTPGSAGPAKMASPQSSGTTMASPGSAATGTGSTPTSGLDRQPGQY